MSQENVEIVRRVNVEALRPVYEEWGRGNWRPRFDVYALDMEWGWSEEFPEFHGVSRDPEARSRRLRAWLSPWEDWRCEAEEFQSVSSSWCSLATRGAARRAGSPWIREGPTSDDARRQGGPAGGFLE